MLRLTSTRLCAITIVLIASPPVRSQETPALLPAVAEQSQAASGEGKEPAPAAYQAVKASGGTSSKGTEFPTVKLTGLFQADTVWFAQSPTNRLAVGDIQDGADFRRARLAATGNVASNVGYMVEFDFGFPGRPSFMDVWMEVQDVALLHNVRVGHYRQPIGLDGLTSVKELTFIERGLPFAFLPFRQIGLMSSGVTIDKASTWAVSAFRFPTDPFGGQIGDDGGYSLATRLTHLLLRDHQFALHLGGAFSLMNPANNRVQYRNQPEIFVSETGGASLVPPGVPSAVPPFVDSGPIRTDFAHLLTAETALTWGAIHGQAELIHALVNRPVAGDVAFYGISAQLAWILTGEHRPYNTAAGVLGRVVPDRPFGHGQWGAWEVAARYSYLDLNDKDVLGGRLSDVTLGVNWYLNRYTKFQLNYIHAMLEDPRTGSSRADIVGLRGHLDF